MDHKHYHATPLEVVELKAGPGSAGIFTAYASTFGNRDHGGDIIEKGAFGSSLKTRTFRPLLWQHDMREPIGIEKSIKEDGKGLLGTWELVDTQRGRDAYALLKAGAVRSMSIGYIPTDWSFRQDNDDIEPTRIIKQIDLLENSVVSIPMNDQAQVQSVKHAEHCDMCASIEAQKVRKERLMEGKNYSELLLTDHASLLGEVADAFCERMRDLTAKLQAGNYELTDAKRNDLHALLETFSGLDAVRPTLEEALAQSKQPAEEKQEIPESVTRSAIALSLEVRRRKLRQFGVEV